MARAPEILANDLAVALAECDLLRFEIERLGKENARLVGELRHKDELNGHLKWVIKRQRKMLVEKGVMLRGGVEVA